MGSTPPPDTSPQPDREADSSDRAQYPAAPQVPADSQQAKVPPPTSVRAAVRLMWAGAAINLIGLIVALASLGSVKSQIRDQLHDAGQQVTQQAVDTGYVTAIVSAIVIGLIGALLWLWMAWKTGQGRRWARIVATVFAAINLASTVLSVSGVTNSTPGSSIVQIVSVVVGVVAVVLLWRRESSRYFTPHQQPTVG